MLELPKGNWKPLCTPRPASNACIGVKPTDPTQPTERHRTVRVELLLDLLLEGRYLRRSAWGDAAYMVVNDGVVAQVTRNHEKFWIDSKTMKPVEWFVREAIVTWTDLMVNDWEVLVESDPS